MRPVLLLASLCLSGLTACGSLDGAFRGCASGYQRPDFARLGHDLSQARARWAGAKTPDYSFDFSQLAEPVQLPTLHVVVRGGAVQSAQVVGDNPSGATPPSPGTVETLFQTISQTLSRQQTEPCPAVSAAYDPADGHPTSFYSANRLANLADGGGGWTLLTFTRP